MLLFPSLWMKILNGFFVFVHCAVTAVDSGVKALEYLGLIEDENTIKDSNIPISSTSNNHVIKFVLLQSFSFYP